MESEPKHTDQSPLASSGGYASDPPPPKRRYELTLTLGADDLKEIDHGLNEIARQIIYEHSRNSTSGGCGVGWHFEIVEHPEMTHEHYVTALHEYLAAKP